MEKLFHIIHEDSDLLVINKPAGLVCHPTKGDEFSSLISRARLHLGANATAHLVNRLDRETSGIVLIAKNKVPSPPAHVPSLNVRPRSSRQSSIAGELGKIWESRAAQKEYLAIVHGHVREESGTINAPLGKDLQSVVAVKDCVRDDGASAQTEFVVERRFFRPSTLNSQPSTFSLLRVVPRTGRKHQIRIHLAHLGHPIVGDKLYGHDEDAYLALVEDRLTNEQKDKLILPYQALHARALCFRWRDHEWKFSVEPEDWFKDFAK